MTMSRVEVITSVERPRRWSRAEKEQLVAASFEPGVTASEVARAAGIHASQLFRWRKELSERSHPIPPQLVPVEVVPVPMPTDPYTSASTPRAVRPRRSGLIEIELPSGCRLRMDRDVDAKALRRVLDALGER
jgi:transposase